MDSTRVDTKKLTKALGAATQSLADAHKALAPFLVLLTQEERLKTLKPGDEALDAVSKAANNLGKSAFEAIVSNANVDLPAIQEDVVNRKLLADFISEVEALAARLNDTKLVWGAEAYGGTLQGYGILKAHGEANAEVAEAIAPLTTHLAAMRKRKKAASGDEPV